MEIENISEFFVLVLERRNSFLGKGIDIASDELTGEQAAKVLSDELGRKIRLVQIPLEQIRQTSQDLALIYEWYDKVRTGVDVASLHQQYPEVNWRTFKDWVKSQNLDDTVAASSTQGRLIPSYRTVNSEVCYHLY